MPTNASKPSKARNVDAEAGMNRTGKKTGKHQPPPDYHVDTEEEEIASATDKDEEQLMDKEYKDDSRRKRTEPQPKSRRDKNVRPTDAADEQDHKDVKSTQKVEVMTSSHAAFMLAASYRTGFTPVSYPIDSEYVPDVSALFTVLEHIAGIISENSLLHEVYPGYTSIGLYLYCAHAVFFNVLRIRSDSKRLTRVERRCLRKYESIGPLESWPIPTPLIGFYQAIGRIIPEGGKYGQIIPALPDYTALTGRSNHGLMNLSAIEGAARLPILPALHTFLRNYGNGTATATDGIFYPTGAPTLAASPDDFLSITSSATTSAAFNTLAFSAGWKQPTETGEDTYIMIDAQKRKIIHRWSIPAPATDFTDLETFLCLQDDLPVSWMSNLLRLANNVCKFFPGSVSLANIPPVTRLETVSHILAEPIRPRNRMTPADDAWYHKRTGWKLTLKGALLRPDAQQAYQMSITSTSRVEYAAALSPATPNIGITFNAKATGPYFTAGTAPAVEMECTDQPDPMDQTAAIIEAKLYDNLGGRAK